MLSQTTQDFIEIMYGGRVTPAHSFDHTRRYQNDVIVYSENELRSALGYVKRGTRVVVASEIPITKPLEIKVAEKLDPTITSQFVVITGFGSGRLTRKAGVEDRFDMFVVSTESLDDPVGIQFLDLSFNGFRNAISIKTQFTTNLMVKGCTAEACTSLLGKAEAVITPSVLLLNGAVSENYCYADPGVVAGLVVPTALSIDVSFDRSLVCDNRVSYPTTLPITGNTAFDGDLAESNFERNLFELSQAVSIKGLHRSVISSNVFKGDVSIVGTGAGDFSMISSNYFQHTLTLSSCMGSQIIGNSIGDLTNDASNSFLVYDGNFMGTTGLASNLLPNAECLIVRNNTNMNPGVDMGGAGRIAIAGEVLGETVIDTRANMFPMIPFRCFIDQLEPTFGMLCNNGVVPPNPLQVATVQFYVPCSKRVLVRLHCQVYDDDKTVDDVGYFRLTDYTTGAPVTMPLVNCNTTQQITVSEGRTPPATGAGAAPQTFEWFVDGNTGGYWTTGQQVTFAVEVAASNNNANLWVVAGNDAAVAPLAIEDRYGPLVFTVEAADRDVELMVPAVGPPLKGGKPPPPPPPKGKP